MANEWIEFSGPRSSYEQNTIINSRRIQADTQPLRNIESSDMTTSRIQQHMNDLEKVFQSWIQNGVTQLQERLQASSMDHGIPVVDDAWTHVPSELVQEDDTGAHVQHLRSTVQNLKRINYSSLARMVQMTLEKMIQCVKFIEEKQTTGIRSIKEKTTQSVMEVSATLRRAIGNIQQAFVFARKAREHLETRYQQTSMTSGSQEDQEYRRVRSKASKWIDAVETELSDLNATHTVPMKLVSIVATLRGRSQTLEIVTPKDAAYEVECIELILANIVKELEDFCTSSNPSMKLLNQIENAEEREKLASLSPAEASKMLSELRHYLGNREPKTTEQLLLLYLESRNDLSSSVGPPFRILQRLRRYDSHIRSALRAFVSAAADVMAATTRREAPIARKLDEIKQTLSQSVKEIVDEGRQREQVLMNAWVRDMAMNTRVLGQSCTSAASVLKNVCLDTLRSISTSAEKYGIHMTHELEPTTLDDEDEGVLKLPPRHPTITSKDAFHFFEEPPEDQNDLLPSSSHFDFHHARILRQSFRVVTNTYLFLISKCAASYALVLQGILHTTKPSLERAIAPTKQQLKQLHTESL